MINFGERLLGFSLMCSAFEHKLPGCRKLPNFDFRGVPPHGLDQALLIFNIINFLLCIQDVQVSYPSYKRSRFRWFLAVTPSKCPNRY